MTGSQSPVALVGDGAVSRALAAGLRARGHAVAPVPRGLDRAGFAAAFGAIEAGALRQIVWAATEPVASVDATLTSLDEAGWLAACEAPLTAFLHCLQAASPFVRRPGGRAVLLIPEVAMIGAPYLAPWATAAEGQRSIAKATARAWGKDRGAVNIVALPSALAAGLGPEANLDRAGLPGRAFPGAPSIEGEVAGVVGGLLGEAWGAVTGTTIAVDGGIWMAP